jgi:hypothetical protein
MEGGLEMNFTSAEREGDGLGQGGCGSVIQIPGMACRE